MHLKADNVCSESSLDSPKIRPLRQPQWHYTSQVALEQILREGRIRTSPWCRDGRLLVRAAWTSAAAIWEPTATATNTITDYWDFAVEDLLGGDMPPVARIEVAPEGLFDWAEHLSRIGVADAHIWHLAESGYECGANPENWAVSPGAIPSSAWVRVEVWVGAWVPIEICIDPEFRQLAALVPDSCRRGFPDTGSDIQAMTLEVEL
jgi:hypothetical protein